MTSGAPSLGVSPPSIRTSPRVSLAPTSPGEAFDRQDGVLGHLILFSAGADDRVHGLNP